MKKTFCSVSKLKENGQITEWCDDLKDEITAYHHEGEIYVISSICPHFAGEFDPLRNDGTLRCKWHDWRFDLKSGKCLSHPVQTCLRHYKFEVADDQIEIIYE